MCADSAQKVSQRENNCGFWEKSPDLCGRGCKKLLCLREFNVILQRILDGYVEPVTNAAGNSKAVQLIMPKARHRYVWRALGCL